MEPPEKEVETFKDQDIKQIKSRSFLSVSSLLAQSSYSAVLGFTAFFILTLKSGVHLLGIYNTVLAMMAFFSYFTNLGLAAAIIQKKEVEEKDLNTAFYIQFFLSVIAVIVGFLLTNQLFKAYKDLPVNAIYLYWSILFSFFVLSFKTIPSILLEKKILIYKVVLVQAIENTLFYASVIIFSLLGFDIFSLVIAVLVRSTVGTIAIFVMNPWFPKLQFSITSAKSLLKFGIPFQGNSFLALIKDDLLIIYLGSVIGLTNLGYLTFGKKYAEFSIRLVMDNINRVAFPLFSGFQNQKDLLKKSVEKIMFYESYLIFPIIIGAMFVFDSILHIIPGYYAKWHMALFSFYFFSLSAFFVSLSSPFINLFNSVGKVKISVYFMILWTVLTWILIPPFIQYFGFNGISIAFFIMSLTFIFVFFKAKTIVDFSIKESFYVSLVSTVCMAVYLLIIRLITVSYFDNRFFHVVLSIIGAGIVYLGVSYILKGKQLYSSLQDLLKRK
ncbi:MAG TPA: oligosaccharide flippase family protein [Candidatus Nitrosocosmicus sp.]|nr:oligosaccharide flippase family protein [Candidatus Nitrosocosmicus sp.]